jgi:hypothetical protein
MLILFSPLPPIADAARCSKTTVPQSISGRHFASSSSTKVLSDFDFAGRAVCSDQES